MQKDLHAVVISEFMDEAAVATLQREFAVTYDPGLVDNRKMLVSKLAGARALIVRNRTHVDEALLAKAPRLRMVGWLGIGLNNINLAACAARQIEVIPATGANARAVAEYVVATARILLRGTYFRSIDVAAGQWPRTALSSGGELAGKMLGLIGFGSVGRLTARVAKALGMLVIAHDPTLEPGHPAWQELDVRAHTLEAVLIHADVVSLHVPLSEDTRTLLNAAALASMKRGAILINTSAGGIVDEQALAAALQSGHLRGAAMDVFDEEPLPSGSPLAHAPNAILTPHIAGITLESNARVSEIVAERVAALLRRTLLES